MKFLATALISIVSLTAFAQPPDSTSLDSLMGEITIVNTESCVILTVLWLVR